jgi:NAD(P)-dependent dehydrogenase (short-subunit alcohol dehydrogenase family)
MLLPDRTAVITGAASGIGLALSERCLAEGMSVVMADIESDVLHDQASRLKADGGSVTAVVCDVSDAAQVEALRDAALTAHGSVHLLCNNAGVASGRPNLKTRPAVWDWVIGVNLLGAAYGCSAFGPLMVDQGDPHVRGRARHLRGPGQVHRRHPRNVGFRRCSRSSLRSFTRFWVTWWVMTQNLSACTA